MEKRKDLFDRLISKYATDLAKYAFACVRSQFDADDLLNEACLRLWKIWDERQEMPDVQNRNWLLGAIGNIAKEKWREKKKYAVNIDELPPAVNGDNLIGWVEEHHQWNHYLDEIKKLLSEEEWWIFDLYVVQGCSYAEISAKLKMPEATLRSKMFRLRQRLKPRIENILKL